MHLPWFRNPFPTEAGYRGKRDRFIHGIDNLDEYVSNLGIDQQCVWVRRGRWLYGLYKNARVFVFQLL